MLHVYVVALALLAANAARDGTTLDGRPRDAYTRTGVARAPLTSQERLETRIRRSWLPKMTTVASLPACPGNDAYTPGTASSSSTEETLSCCCR